MEKILIIYSYGPTTGLGHYKRSLIIEKELKKKNYVLKLCLDDRKLKKIKFNKNILKKIREKKIEKVFLDINLSTKIAKYDLLNFFDSCKTRNILTIGIDSLIKYYSKLNYVWLPSPYKPKKIEGNNIIFGWDKLILEKIKKNFKYKKKKSILILAGNTKNSFVLKKLPLLISKYIPEDYKLTWILGKFSVRGDLYLQNNYKHKIYHNVKSIKKFLSNTGYVFCLYGLSFFESLSYGIPTSSYVTQKNYKKDFHEIKYLKKKKIAFIDNNIEKSIKNLQNLIKNDSLSKNFSIRSKKLLSSVNFEFLNGLKINKNNK